LRGYFSDVQQDGRFELEAIENVVFGHAFMRGDVFQDAFQGAYPHRLVSGYEMR
jgi:hypothetical protein